MKSNSSQDSIKPIPLFPEPSADHMCEICERTFPSSIDLLSHWNSGFSLDSSAIVYFSRSRHIEGQEVDPTIPNCFSIVHVVQPAEDCVCESCGQSFKNSKGLQQHIGKKHSEELRCFACARCGKKYKNKYTLKTHTNQVHKKNTQVQCQDCGKTVYNKYLLKNHQRKHCRSNLCELNSLDWA